MIIKTLIDVFCQKTFNKIFYTDFIYTRVNDTLTFLCFFYIEIEIYGVVCLEAYLLMCKDGS